MKKKIVISLIALFFSIAIFFVCLYIYLLGPVGTSTESVLFEVKSGSSTSSIISDLKKEELIKNELVAKIYTKLNPSLNMKAGTYELNDSFGTKKIIKLLHDGNTIEKKGIKVTFIEGKTLKEYVKQISTTFKITEEEILNTINDKNYLNKLIKDNWFITDEILNEDIYIPLEGYLYPDTYNFDIDATTKDIINKMINTLGIKLALYKEKIENSKYSVHQILSLASDIEKEGNTAEDRAIIAGVFLNRLNIKMPLGSDVTTYYAFNIPLGSRGLYYKELNQYNAYNTRGPNMSGIINVGPICSPSLSSIKAVIEPSDTDYLYFYADYMGDGKVYYSKTLAEHQATVRRFES